MKAQVHCPWPLVVPADFPRPVTIHVDCKKRSPKSPRVFDVLYLCEPQSILPKMSAYALTHLDLFDLIVVSTDHLVGASPKIVLNHLRSEPPSVETTASRSGIARPSISGAKARTTRSPSGSGVRPFPRIFPTRISSPRWERPIRSVLFSSPAALFR